MIYPRGSIVENDFIDKRKQVVKIKMESNIKVQLSKENWTIIKSTYQNYNYKRMMENNFLIRLYVVGFLMLIFP